jgi:hypothetical protein
MVQNYVITGIFLKFGQLLEFLCTWRTLSIHENSLRIFSVHTYLVSSRRLIRRRIVQALSKISQIPSTLVYVRIYTQYCVCQISFNMFSVITTSFSYSQVNAKFHTICSAKYSKSHFFFSSFKQLQNLECGKPFEPKPTRNTNLFPHSDPTWKIV